MKNVLRMVFMKIIFASNNKGKIRELKEILKDYDIVSLNEMNIDIEIEEDGESFYENALKKAKAIYELTGIPTIADDSGLIFDELGDWPGVNTKRISNNLDNDEQDRNQILIKKGLELENKNIRAVCSLVYYDKDNIIDALGIMQGTITEKEYPGNGFGFDRVFRLLDGRVVSSLTEEEKNKLSHRSQAAFILKEKLNKIL